MSSEPADTTDGDLDGDSPIYRAKRTPEDIPGFVDRALGHVRAEAADDDFTLEGVDFEIAAGVWLAPIGAYDPDEDEPSTPEQIAAGAGAPGPWGGVMLAWEASVRRAMRSSWGEPVVHTPRLAGIEQKPEGILDYLMVAQEFEAAELWDRGELFVALLTRWQGEPGVSALVQVLVVLPREFVMGGMAALMSEDATEHELLMHGESPLEVRRRAWLMSTIYGAGEARLREVPIAATRCSLRAIDGTTTVWTFADDGRALLLVWDPSCEFATTAARASGRDDAPTNDDAAPDPGAGGYAGRSDGELILMHRLLDGVPDDLRACIAARAETARGEVAEHALEFGLLHDQPVPIISGAFWFDGDVWHASRGLMQLGHQNGFGLDDYGFGAAVRRPYRLGGSFTLDGVAHAADADRKGQLVRVFDACPFPEQPRPEGDVRLGYAIPSSADREGIIQGIDRATAAWWDQSPSDARLGDDTFVIGGRKLRGRDGEGVLTSVLAVGEPWTVDALQTWTNALADAMTERWGQSREMTVHDSRTGIERRTPLTRVMRGTGLTQAPLWWVNGHAVLLLAGNPDPVYSTEPQVILVICRADAVLELLGRTGLWEIRRRARVIKNLAALVAAADGATPTSQHVAAAQPVAWDGPPLAGSDVVPLATRGGLRAGTFSWVWHFTHDGRGLLTSHEIGGRGSTFSEQVELFTGVPEDLLSLVVDREPAGPYPVVVRDGEHETSGVLGRARSLPDAVAVFFRDDVDWRASEGMLRRARAASTAQEEDLLAALYSTTTGVRQLQWVLRGDDALSPAALADPEYARLAFSREVSLDEATAALEQVAPALVVALTGTLNDVLDAIVDSPGYRAMLDAALSNTDPQDRREIALWLLGEGADPSQQLSFMTPISVLLENPTLDGGDAVLLSRLLEAGADAGFGLLGPRRGGHPLVQLCERDLDEAEIDPLVEVLLGVAEPAEGEAARYDVTAPLLADGRSLLEYLSAGAFTHQRPRTRLLERLERLA